MASGAGQTEEILIGSEALPPAGVWRPPFGAVIFQFLIPVHSYPWKAPRVSRSGSVRLKRQTSSYRTWKSWSTDITMVVHHAVTFHGVPVPRMGPLDLDTLFVVDGSRPYGDATNLRKSLEDIFQGILYRNDRQVEGGDLRRALIGSRIVGREDERWEGPERIHVRLTSLL